MMLSPPAEHESLAGRTCPPEDTRLHAPHDVSTEQHSLIAENADSSLNAPAQQPTPPPTERESLAHAHSQSESSSKPPESTIEGPVRDIPTPMSATDDSAEEQRNIQASPLSATAPAPVSWSQHKYLASPYPSYRVCITVAAASGTARTRPVLLTSVAVSTEHIIIAPPSR